MVWAGQLGMRLRVEAQAREQMLQRLRLSRSGEQIQVTHGAQRGLGVCKLSQRRAFEQQQLDPGGLAGGDDLSQHLQAGLAGQTVAQG